MRISLHIYDIQKSCNQKGADVFGVGIYHTGVEINGVEFAYGGNTTVRSTGVYSITPRQHLTFSYKTTIELGEMDADQFLKRHPRKREDAEESSEDCPEEFKGSKLDFDEDIWPILQRLMNKYRAYKYDLLTFNCNHFSDELIRILFVGKKKIPNYINRAAYLGSWFHCFVPRKYRTVTPADHSGEDTTLMNKKWKEEDEMDTSDFTVHSQQPCYDTSGFIDKHYYSYMSTEPSSIRPPLGDPDDDADLINGSYSSDEANGDSSSRVETELNSEDNLFMREKSGSPTRRKLQSREKNRNQEMSPEEKEQLNQSEGWSDYLNPFSYFKSARPSEQEC